MARRILGAFIILHALAPLILLSVFALASVMAARRISHAAGAYRRAIGAQVDTARATFARANQGFTALGNYFTVVNRAVDRAARDVAGLASSISIPLPNIRPIPIPGAAQFKRAVEDVAAVGRVVGNDIGKITSLATVPAQLTEISSATREFAGEVRSAAVRWIVVFLGVLSFGAAVWFIGSVARIVVEVRRGWNLLWGVAPAH